MKLFLEKLSFKQLIWLIPVFTAVHNLEEAPQMERWAAEHLASLPQIPFLLEYFLPVSTTQFWLATLLIDFSVLFLSFLCSSSPPKGAGIYLLSGIQAIMLLNSINHFFISALLLQYQPGVLTGILISLPFSIYFFKRAFREEYVQKKFFIYTFIAAIILYPTSAGAFLIISKVVLSVF